MNKAQEVSNCYASLIVELGAPHEKGCRFLLEKSKVCLGRATRSFTPDIAFSSMLVSRKHCCLEKLDGKWTVSELGSKHGTLLNGKLLPPGVACTLQPGDTIGLASNLVLLRFILSSELDQTFEFTGTQPLKNKTSTQSKIPFTIDPAKQAVEIDQAEVYLSLKEWRLLELLYRNKNKLVSYEEIRREVWDERNISPDGLPDVGADELNILVYRLRRKLGNQSGRLITRRGQGCILELD